MEIENKGINSVKGFACIGKHIGIKKKKKDIAVLYSKNICNTVAVFTKNKIKGAPLYVTKEHLHDGKAQAIVINSGIANVSTGQTGIDNAGEMTEIVANELEISKDLVLVASTGIIGKPLPMEKIRHGLVDLKNELETQDSGDDFANAILTTDTATKQVSVTTEKFAVAGTAKGSGMISPNMATMLAFIVTDADICTKNLQNMFSSGVNKSFNMINVDMDTSTSDMAIIMANGIAGKVDENIFKKALDIVCIELAKMIAMDGEGATKLIVAKAINAKTTEDAKKIAKAIVNSTLIKCAIFGNDPNYGRVLCAIGNTDAEFEENKIQIFINDFPVFTEGQQSPDFDIKKISKSIMEEKTTTITIILNSGTEQATAYGCDMSYDYVKINSCYTT